MEPLADDGAIGWRVLRIAGSVVDETVLGALELADALDEDRDDVTHTMSEIRRPATASARSARVQPENIAINPATNSTADPRAS
eukprot:CAMPEP_0180141340 /NCGR_PEP_ID=MMETSP0986-20121125/14834_1 /TAXON_ID=697907 /ORGANISM="non described non described, Strain CCMP2293" /LENGTH=83 /DNA_ID=CAMNT_0022084143 /DNA_START=218 /DNA_END=470 /DNA_ORIENTATION=+